MNIPFVWDIILDYFRAVCYAIVVLTDLRGVVVRKFDNLLYVGDVVIALALFIAAFNSGFGMFDLRAFNDIILTPAALLWAGIHFYEFIKKT